MILTMLWMTSFKKIKKKKAWAKTWDFPKLNPILLRYSHFVWNIYINFDVNINIYIKNIIFHLEAVFYIPENVKSTHYKLLPQVQWQKIISWWRICLMGRITIQPMAAREIHSYIYIQWSCSLVTFCMGRYCYSLNYHKGHSAGIEIQASQVLSKQISRVACLVIWLGPSQVELNCQSKSSKYEYLTTPMEKFLLIGWNWQ